MGANSAINITRSDAIFEIIKKLYELSDSELERVCDKLEIAGKLRSHYIVDEYVRGGWDNFYRKD